MTRVAGLFDHSSSSGLVAEQTQAAANHVVVGWCLCACSACMPQLVSRARPGKPVNVILVSEVSVLR